MKLKLPKVTLICLTGNNIEGHRKALQASSKDIEWGGIKLIYDASLDSIDKWNKAIVYDLWKYVETEFAMLVHADGYVVNAEQWREDWLKYDYIGAPWPLPSDDYSYRTPEGEIVRVGNSVSLRSTKLMLAPYMLRLPWKPYYGNTNEDGFLCVHNRKALEAEGVKFAPLEVAKHFAHEVPIPETQGITPFAFHRNGYPIFK